MLHALSVRSAGVSPGRPPAAAMDAEQAYVFDVNGFIVLRNVLTQEELGELRALAKPVEAGNMESMLHLKIYRDTMCHPAVTPIIQQLCGDNYRLDHLNVHTHVAAGFKGGGLHGSHHPGGGAGFYQLLNGAQFLNGLISVTYELYDTHCNNGGFCCIPGALPIEAQSSLKPWLCAPLTLVAAAS